MAKGASSVMSPFIPARWRPSMISEAAGHRRRREPRLFSSARNNTTATNALDRDTDIAKVQEWLGHFEPMGMVIHVRQTASERGLLSFKGSPNISGRYSRCNERERLTLHG